MKTRRCAVVLLLATACGSSQQGPGGPDGGPSGDGGSGRIDGSRTQRDAAPRDASAKADARAPRHDARVPPGDGHAPRDAEADVPTHVMPAHAYNIGMNIEGLTYYNDMPLYADLALVFAANNGRWDALSGDAAATLDASGNPTVPSWTGVTADYPSGAYALSWDGTGSVTVGAMGTAAVASMGAVTTSMTGGVQHNTATVTLTQQLSTATAPQWFSFNATPPVSNVHVMAPSSEVPAGSMFMKDFITRMQPFSTIRFMDPLNTNGNLVKDWSERTWPAGGSRGNTPQGMAYEDIIALANETGADIWINVPALATDDYVCRMARLFRYGEQGDMSNSACSTSAPAGTATTAPLNTKSKLYVEYSNEVWNWGFQQIEDIYCMVWGMPDQTTNGKHCDVTAPTSTIGAAALADTSLPWTNSNTYNKATEFTLVLVKRVSDEFRAVFGCSSGTGCQVQIPMNVQAAYAAEVDPGFSFLKQAYGSTSAIDFMAVAPYFGFDSGDDSSVDALFGDITGSILASTPDAGNGNAIVNWLTGDLAEANKYGLPLVAYEGGQGLASASENTIAAQSDPRMYAAYQTYFSLWDKLVGRDHLFNHFDYVGTYGSYGSWGALVNQTDPGSQKWDALMSVTRLAGDANLDGVVNREDCAILQAHFGMSGQWWMQGDFNHDGVVDASDLALLNANIVGARCTM